ncbi:MAG: alpha/beta fold hydrolase [Planctomycetota bacterium]
MVPIRLPLPRRLSAAVLLVGLAAVGACAAEPGGGVDSMAEGRLAQSESEVKGDCPAEPASALLDVWVASTRRLPVVCRPPEHADLAIEQLVDDGGCRRWEQAELPGLLADPHGPLVFFVHGNRYEPADAKSQGILLAQRIAAARGGQTPRVVILSWPSQKQGVLLKDGRRKYERASADGQYLAWLLGKVEPERPVAIVGYSFGALVATEALDELARRDETRGDGIRWADRPGRTHLVFVVPALRADALAPRGPFSRTIAGIDRLTLLINSRDEALRFFPLLQPDVRAPALGFVGMPRRWLPPEVEYDAVDAAGIVGKLHTMGRYLDARSLAERIAGGVLDGLAAE